MTTVPTEIEAVEQAESILADLHISLPMLTGSLVASADGHALAAELDEERQRSLAAIVASSFALGQKLAQVGGSDEAEEMVVRHGKGYVAIFAVGPSAALVVLAMDTINLGMLKHRAESAVERLGPLVPMLARRATS